MTGTDSTLRARACAKFTLTDAWSSPAPEWLPGSVIVTGIVEPDEPLPPPLPLPPLRRA